MIASWLGLSPSESLLLSSTINAAWNGDKEDTKTETLKLAKEQRARISRDRQLWPALTHPLTHSLGPFRIQMQLLPSAD